MIIHVFRQDVLQDNTKINNINNSFENTSFNPGTCKELMSVDLSDTRAGKDADLCPDDNGATPYWHNISHKDSLFYTLSFSFLFLSYSSQFSLSS